MLVTRDQFTIETILVINLEIIMWHPNFSSLNQTNKIELFHYSSQNKISNILIQSYNR